MKTTTDAIRDHIQQLGVSRSVYAAMLGTTPQRLSSILTGFRGPPRPSTVSRWLKSIDAELHYGPKGWRIARTGEPWLEPEELRHVLEVHAGMLEEDEEVTRG